MRHVTDFLVLQGWINSTTKVSFVNMQGCHGISNHGSTWGWYLYRLFLTLHVLQYESAAQSMPLSITCTSLPWVHMRYLTVFWPYRCESLMPLMPCFFRWNLSWYISPWECLNQLEWFVFRHVRYRTSWGSLTRQVWISAAFLRM